MTRHDLCWALAVLLAVVVVALAAGLASLCAWLGVNVSFLAALGVGFVGAVLVGWFVLGLGGAALMKAMDR